MKEIFKLIQDNTLDSKKLETLLVLHSKLLFEQIFLYKLGDSYFSINPLNYAILQDNEAITRLLLERGAQLISGPGDDWTPLHYAAVNGNTPIAKLLIDYGHPIDSTDGQGYTPLLNAIEKGQIETALYLLEQGANPNQVTDIGYSVLHEAVFTDSIDLVEALIKSGADLNAVDSSFSATPLHLAVANHTEVTKVLLAAGADFNIKNVYNNLPLHVASWMENLESVTALLEAGADPNGFKIGDFFDWPDLSSLYQLSAYLWSQVASHALNSPLNLAVLKNNLALANLLLAHGADPALQIERTETALSLAKRLEKTEFLKLFEEPLNKKSEPVDIDAVLESGSPIPGLNDVNTETKHFENSTFNMSQQAIPNDLLGNLSLQADHFT